MELKAKLKSLDEVKDKTVSLSELYVEKDGEFCLNAVEVDGYGIDNVGGMRTVLEDAKYQKKKAKEELDTIKREHDSAKIRLAELEANSDGKSKDKFEALRKELEEGFKNQIAEINEKNKILSSKLKTVSIDGELNRVLAKLEPTADGLKILPKYLQDQFDLDEAGNVIVKGDNGVPKVGEGLKNMSIEEYLTKKVKSEYPGLFKNTMGGSGAPPSGKGSGAMSGKTMPVKEFNSKPAQERIAFMSAGGTLTD